jgi:splicing factor 3B subunit 4
MLEIKWKLSLIRITGSHQGFGFIEFMSEEDADYAIKIMNMIKLFGKPIKGF